MPPNLASSRPEWLLVHEVNDFATECGVHVYASDVAPRTAPRDANFIPVRHYSVRIVRLHDGKAHQNFPIVATTTGGVVHCPPPPAQRIAELMLEAHAWVVKARQERQDQIAAKQQAQHEAKGKGPHGQAVRGLGTLAKEDAIKRAAALAAADKAETDAGLKGGA